MLPPVSFGRAAIRSKAYLNCFKKPEICLCITAESGRRTLVVTYAKWIFWEMNLIKSMALEASLCVCAAYRDIPAHPRSLFCLRWKVIPFYIRFDFFPHLEWLLWTDRHWLLRRAFEKMNKLDFDDDDAAEVQNVCFWIFNLPFISFAHVPTNRSDFLKLSFISLQHFSSIGAM